MTTLARTAPPRDVFFQGRPGDSRFGEWVRSTDSLQASPDKHSLALYGCPDDKGVRLNRGRPGAQFGPDSIRRHFYKMTLPADVAWNERLDIVDFGNLIPSEDLLETHRRALAMASAIAASGRTGIALGGGHDFAAPNFLGFAAGAGAKRLGLINVDPHLDVRELENGKPHSGTPFREILESGKLAGKDFVEFGARASRNARAHWKYCLDHKVTIDPFETIRAKATTSVAQFMARLKALARVCDAIGVTIDMDACSDGEGVSAAPVLGFSTWELCGIAAVAGAHPQVRHFEIAEVAPALDFAERTSRIAAELIHSFVRARALCTKGKPKPDTSRKPRR